MMSLCQRDPIHIDFCLVDLHPSIRACYSEGLAHLQAMQALLPLLAVGPELGNTLGCDDCCCCCCRGGCRAGAWAWLDPFMSFPCSHGLSSFRAGLSCTGLVSVHEEEYALFSRP